MQGCGGIGPRKMPRACESCVSRMQRPCFVAKSALDRVSECPCVNGIDKRAGLSNDFGQRAAGRGDHRYAG